MSITALDCFAEAVFRMYDSRVINNVAFGNGAGLSLRRDQDVAIMDRGDTRTDFRDRMLDRVWGSLDQTSCSNLINNFSRGVPKIGFR